MAQFYVDSDIGLDTNDGLSIGAAFKTINKFTETARAAGDICTIRRGRTARIDDGGQLDFTSDGTYADPLVVEADFDDSWADFANSAQTFTPVFGSKVMTASATITGISVGDWIYNLTDSDDPREFAYEVAAVSGTTLTLFLPWKGSTGATKTLKVMPPAPVWGSTTGFTFRAINNSDNHWLLKGIEFQTASTSYLLLVSSLNVVIADCILKGTSGTELVSMLSGYNVYFLKTRWFEYERAFDANEIQYITCENCLFDGNSLSQYMNANSHKIFMTFIECEIKGHNLSDIGGITARLSTHYTFRNCIFGSTNKFSNVANKLATGSIILIEDFNNSIGKTVQHGNQSLSETSFIIESTSATLRTGGSNLSLIVNPSTLIGGGVSDRLLVFEYPIYASTTSKTYTVYFKSNAIADWTANPTALECFLEFDAWGHATNKFRKKTRSTGTVDFKTNTNFDKALSVTVAPAQAGVAYLRLYYGKPKESGVDNKFYIDPKVVIT